MSKKLGADGLLEDALTNSIDRAQTAYVLLREARGYLVPYVEDGLETYRKQEPTTDTAWGQLVLRIDKLLEVVERSGVS